jgi:NAD(P)-dependent dehydrogenase (short-subunit alcohol dehydrogenase family)
MRMMRAVLPQMLQAGVGAIVNAASLSGLRAAKVGALRIGSADPDDIASLISWLSCAESRHVNGAIVTADGGWSSA